MAINLGQSNRWIVAELSRNRSTEKSMASLIDWCEAAHPHPDWEKLRKLPYADLSQLSKWIVMPFRTEASKIPLKGLWFGLFNPWDGRTTVADIYVCGSNRFNPDPDDNDWAVGPNWWPDSRYAGSTILADIYRIAYRTGATLAEQNGCLGNDSEYPLVLGFGAFAVQELLRQSEPSLILAASDSLGVAVGFDSGDFVLLGHLTRNGLTPLS